MQEPNQSAQQPRPTQESKLIKFHISRLNIFESSRQIELSLHQAFSMHGIVKQISIRKQRYGQDKFAFATIETIQDEKSLLEKLNHVIICGRRAYVQLSKKGCFRCNQMGHRSNECQMSPNLKKDDPNRKGDLQEQRSKSRDTTNFKNRNYQSQVIKAKEKEREKSKSKSKMSQEKKSKKSAKKSYHRRKSSSSSSSKSSDETSRKQQRSRSRSRSRAKNMKKRQEKYRERDSSHSKSQKSKNKRKMEKKKRERSVSSSSSSYERIRRDCERERQRNIRYRRGSYTSDSS